MIKRRQQSGYVNILPWCQCTPPVCQLWWTSCVGGRGPEGSPEGTKRAQCSLRLPSSDHPAAEFSSQLPSARLQRCSRCCLCRSSSRSTPTRHKRSSDKHNQYILWWFVYFSVLPIRLMFILKVMMEDRELVKLDKDPQNSILSDQEDI